MLKVLSVISLCIFITGCAVHSHPVVYDNRVQCTLVPVKDQTGTVLYHRKICRRPF